MAVQYPQPINIGYTPGTDVTGPSITWMLPPGYVYLNPNAALFGGTTPPEIIPWVLVTPGYLPRATPGPFTKVPDIGSDPGTRFILNDLANAGLSIDQIDTYAMQAVKDEPTQDPFDWSHGYMSMLNAVAVDKPDLARSLALSADQIASARAWAGAIGTQAKEAAAGSRFDHFMAQWGWLLPIAGFVGTALVVGGGTAAAVTGAEAATTTAAPATAAGATTTAAGGVAAAGGAAAAAGAGGGGLTVGTGLSAAGAAASVSQAVTTGTSAATAAASTGVAATAGSVVSGIESFISQAKGFVSDFITPIKSVVDNVTSLVRDVNDNLIAPITNTISTTLNTYKTLVTELHDDLKGGLAGLVKIPGQIADAFTSVDASLNRAMQQLGLQNLDIAKGVLVPGMHAEIGAHLANLSAMVGRPEGLQSSAAAVQVTDRLVEGLNVGDVETTINKFLAASANPTTWYEWVLNWVVNFVQVNMYLVQKLENAVEPYADAVRTNNPYTKLEPGVIMEAARRGIMTPDDAGAEMLRLGYNPERQRIMFDAERYLFGVRDAVTLYQRGEIDRATYLLLASQNGMDEGQASFALALAGYIFNPKDAAGLLAREVVNNQTFEAICAASGLDRTQAQAVLTLALSLVNPQAQLQYTQRTGAVSRGFLAETFSIPLPTEVADQYERNQVEEAQAVIDWFMHWDIPNVDWWVQAYFRGLRTKSECYAAFDFYGIPRETWDDQFTVRGEVISAFILLEILKQGVIDADTARRIMTQQGMIPEHIDILISFAEKTANPTKAAHAATTHEVSTAVAGELYADGAIDKPTYHDILTGHGFTEQAAELTIELADIRAAQAERKAFGEALVQQVQLGLVDMLSAQSQLASAGFSNAEMLRWGVKLEQAKLAGVKLPSRAELDAMLKKGVIDQTQWASAMSALGYTPDWIPLLAQIV